MSKENRGWPTHVLGGRFRTSTLALVVAFLLVWWLYEMNQPEPTSQPQAPETQVVPPGFVPDPNYTWVPRTDVQPSRTATPTTTTPTTTTTTPTETTSPTSPTDTTTSGPPTTTTPAPPAAPPAPLSPAAPGPGPSPSASR